MGGTGTGTGSEAETVAAAEAEGATSEPLCVLLHPASNSSSMEPIIHGLTDRTEVQR